MDNSYTEQNLSSIKYLLTISCVEYKISLIILIKNSNKLLEISLCIFSDMISPIIPVNIIISILVLKNIYKRYLYLKYSKYINLFLLLK